MELEGWFYDILNKLKELKFIEETTVEVDGESINLYKTRQFTKIVGLFAYLDLVSKANKNYYFYFGRPTNYFNKEGNMNDQTRIWRIVYQTNFKTI